LCLQRPETPIFAHTQEAHYQFLNAAQNVLERVFSMKDRDGRSEAGIRPSGAAARVAT
jgi:hypothetical protein